MKKNYTNIKKTVYGWGKIIWDATPEKLLELQGALDFYLQKYEQIENEEIKNRILTIITNIDNNIFVLKSIINYIENGEISSSLSSLSSETSESTLTS